MSAEAIRDGLGGAARKGMAWFGSAAFLLGLAGEHLDALMSGAWERAVGFALILAVGLALVLAGAPDNRRIRTSRRRVS